MNRNEAIERAARKLQLQKLGGYGIDANTWIELGEALAMPKDADGCAVCGEAYQVVGALWNGETNLVPVLDNLSASATGKPIPHDTLLPFVPKADAEPIAWIKHTKYGDGVSFDKRFFELFPNFYNGKPEPSPERVALRERVDAILSIRNEATATHTLNADCPLPADVMTTLRDIRAYLKGGA